MQKYSVAIAGAGASGIMAAVSARRRGVSVVICERLPVIGKKLLASGNGRCNLLNDRLDESFYNTDSRNLVRNIFAEFGKDDIKGFFSGLGLELYSDNGRIFPATNQSASVLKILELELKKLAVPVELNFEVTGITRSAEGYVVTSASGKKISAGSVILAGGGKSYPALGSNGSVYKLAELFGHKIIQPVPVAVPLVVKDPIFHFLQGQRIAVSVRAIIDGREANTASGELLFTKYGLSGTAILDISEPISIALNRYGKKDACIRIDLVPFMGEEMLKGKLAQRIHDGILPEDLLAGLLPNKFGASLRNILKSKDAVRIASLLKNLEVKITGTRGWNEAEFTAGGIDTRDVNESTLESKLAKGLYFAGEALNVNGKRGGYNLAWAWASGFVAGKTG